MCEEREERSSISVCMCIIIKIRKQNFARNFPNNSTNYTEINIYYETILGVCIDAHIYICILILMFVRVSSIEATLN